MKTSATLFIISTVLLIVDTAVFITGRYQYSKHYSSYWNLAEKASSIEKKIEGIDKFVAALDGSNLKGKYNAIFMETPDNSFDENFAALKSLQIRLHEIKEMDIKSFEYQTALQQITQQEQTEAGEMLDVFSGIWWKDNHVMLWGWVGATQVLLLCGVCLFTGFVWLEDN